MFSHPLVRAPGPLFPCVCVSGGAPPAAGATAGVYAAVHVAPAAGGGAAAALATARWAEIPRAREVGQSFGSSVPSTLHALWACVRLIWTASPDLVLVNGPGTCVPVAVLARLFGSRVIFAESWCRVSTLSLTGCIMYWVAHRFVVHWPELVRRYPRAEYLGRIC